MNPAIFREYDIRGVADQDFDVDFAFALGRAYGTLAMNQGKRRVSVGRDCRPTSDKYAAALRQGLCATGLGVLELGVCPTPLMYFSLHHYDLDGGIQVTGSHNPAEHNGFKICLGKCTIHGEDIQELRALIEKGSFVSGQGKEVPTRVIPPYQEFVSKQFGRLGREISVVVDAGNSTGGPVAPLILRSMGCQVTELFCELDFRSELIVGSPFRLITNFMSPSAPSSCAASQSPEIAHYASATGRKYTQIQSTKTH